MSETILFLHGAGLSHRMWTPVIELLPEFVCLAPDLPEHGAQPLPGPLTWDNTLHQLATMLTLETEQPVHVVGLSLGGAVGLTLAVRQPTLVKSLILSGTATRLHPLLAWIQNLNAPLLRWLPPKWTVQLMAQQFNIPEPFWASVEADLRHFSPGVMSRTNTLLTTLDPPERVSVPSLVLVGEHETFVARRMAQTYHHHIAGAVGYTVPAVGHAWTYQNPALFADTVRAWVTQSPLPSTLQPL